ncbi:sensor histidine kinase [Paracraurococcus lichenis]|uniref:histidine kinase n=1 Tax=Paracraurococcus lichenis TaxID=3064888 RepID=A0ABT9E6H3_9PROT|nr:HWE histidine kinase domain-containing protein [Paracraurococcus sp. LOR1-02]MDO9711719.1 HWE histidine kinase domain-containing protein [Paracraurococcus sp. LOR1-02]
MPKPAAPLPGSETPAPHGDLAALIRDLDGAGTPLGSPSAWPRSLAATVDLMLAARAQIVLFWGPEFVALYNDAYAPTIGDKHPRALGRPARENWAELWDDLEPLLRGVRETGETFHASDRPFYIERHGYGETVYFDVSYSAVRDEAGGVGGVLCIVSETTGRVLAAQRQAFRLALAQRLRDLSEPQAVMEASVELLGRHLGANRVGYGEVQPDDATVILHTCWTDGVGPLQGAWPLDGFGRHSIAEQRRGLTQWSADLARDPDQDPALWAALETRAAASVPLIRGGRFAASLYVNFRAPHPWTPEEIALIEEVAARTWAEVERARVERQQALILTELNHRVKNILATTQGIAATTLKAAGGDPARFAEQFGARLRTLARAHDMLTARQWEPAGVETTIRTALSPWIETTRAVQIAIAGEARTIAVSPRQAQALVLAFHELATNAVKYGALSQPAGQVTIRCEAGPGGSVRLRWTEAGGPPLSGPPGRRGFGTRLLERGLASDLGRGSLVELRFAPAGLEADIAFVPDRPDRWERAGGA